MKKYILIIFIVFGLISVLQAQTFQRTDKMPNFFVPQGAFRTGSETEKLPPIENLMTATQPKTEESYKKNASLKSGSFRKISTHQKPQTQAYVDDTKSESKIENVAKDIDNSNSYIITEETPEDYIEEQPLIMSNTPQQNYLPKDDTEEGDYIDTAETIFDTIIAEFREDAQKISQNRNADNQRLHEVLDKFNGQYHTMQSKPNRDK